LAEQTKKYKETLNKMEEDLDYANTCLIGYQEMFQTPPKGYVANTKLSSFTIPVREGHSVPAKWVKQLDDGQVTGYGESNGEGDLPYAAEIYTEPSYSSADPPEVFPHWLSKTLQGQELITTSSKKWSKVLATGGFTPKLCGIEILMSKSSITKPSSILTMPTCMQPKLPTPNALPG